MISSGSEKYINFNGNMNGHSIWNVNAGSIQIYTVSSVLTMKMLTLLPP